MSITDFRSIRGTNVTVPLDSPVVLIHGPNGIGKTSILSAIELALTGRTASLAKLDPHFYNQYLVHKAATEARVSITVEGIDGPGEQTAEMKVSQGSITGQPLLSTDLARFYTERCYLAQSTLGRLLELYQDKDARLSDSPLTKFVKELLGLDQLDALIDGLHDTGNVRRLRTGTPLFWEARDEIPKLEKDKVLLQKEMSVLNSEAEQLKAEIQQKLEKLSITVPLERPLDGAIRSLHTASRERELQQLARARRDIQALIDQWASTQSAANLVNREQAQTAVNRTRAALEAWLSTSGKRLESLFSDLASFFPDLPSPTDNRPESARLTALRLVERELTRLESIQTRDDEAQKRLTDTDSDIARHAARMQALDEQIANHSSNAGELASALARVVPHIHSDNCPVCDRHFSEVSQTPLAAYVSNKIASLTESAGRLQALAKERAESSVARSSAERQRSVISGQVLADEARQKVKAQAARLSELKRDLDTLATDTTDGEQTFRSYAAAFNHLNSLEVADQRARSIREATALIAQQIAVDPVKSDESLDTALRRIQTHIESTEEALGQNEVVRLSALDRMRQLSTTLERQKEHADTLKVASAKIARLSAQKALAERRIESGKELARRARSARTDIVRRVFNDSLNAMWRDLFVRLAPDEPFVPAFALPEGNDIVEAVLETVYRRGGKGGNPRAVLSAGNLNTAALTLFLALHLSVEAQLPWLLIDDPVQSMDEVHIAQLAALLRTLSRQHARQIIVAVHEKPLFDYLSLELSPAFQHDRLTTVEIERAADGRTVVKYEPHIWAPDEAIAA